MRKELADYVTSIRFIASFLLVIVVSVTGLVAASQGIRSANLPEGIVFLGLFTTSGTVIPSLTYLVSLLIPIIGIALGFDAINSERTDGTLSRVLAQPVFRDSVINGKFLAGVVTLSIMVGTMLLLIAGYGLSMIGVPPTPEEIIRLFGYFVMTIVYGAFWMGLAILFSIVFRRVAASLLFSLALWMFFSIFILLIAPGIANVLASTADGSQAELIRNMEVQRMITRVSPNVLFQEATTVLLVPLVRSLGMVSQSQAAYMVPNPLSLGQSILLVWPHITSLISLSAVCFAVSYILFMRQEIRAT
ncbi:MAG: ABC transporter permease subunit [Dehalococcoidales bacterium]|nr:ABC transporter permease subunit [Dehalococcoidales bacterium]